MPDTASPTTAQYGELIQLISPTNKSFLIRLSPGIQFHTHRGIINHDDLVNKPFGSEVFSHTGGSYIILKPALGDLLMETRRNTQIMYPKDIGYLLIKMGIGSGQHVLEAGTGSGALTSALAWSVGPAGKITSYEVRAEMQQLARKNLAKLGVEDRVELKLKDIVTGFDDEDVDAVFLDLPNPYDYMHHVYKALIPGGSFGCILPTTNQVSRLLTALHQNNFAFIEVCEILLRFYKPVYNRLRPTDRMVAHTGYLIFARAIIPTSQDFVLSTNSIDEHQEAQDEI
jgi:tRNA (adenine57-N1/adenine58-N1)-methyltransferase